MGDSTDDYMALSDRYTQYFFYAKYGYKPCEQYEYAIEAPIELKAVLARIALKERQSVGTPYRVFSRGDNQITLIPKGKDHSCFGFVKCADENFDAVVKELLAGSTGKLIGPIDVAMITKSDGFIWMKRKHYFDQSYNPQYFYSHYFMQGGMGNGNQE